MKKIIYGFGIAVVLSFFLVNETSAAADVYEMVKERCPNLDIQKRCRPAASAECNPSDQTSCKIIIA